MRQLACPPMPSTWRSLEAGDASCENADRRHANASCSTRPTGDVPAGRAAAASTSTRRRRWPAASVAADDQRQLLGIRRRTAHDLDAAARRRRAVDGIVAGRGRDTLRRPARCCGWVGPALVALVAGLAWLLAGRALRPVHAGHHAGRRHRPPRRCTSGCRCHRRRRGGRAGPHDQRDARPPGDADLTSRRLVSDASHELRTPITVIRTELEVARRDRRHRLEAT